MAVTAVAFNEFAKSIGDDRIDMDNATANIFKVMLVDGYTIDQNDLVYTDVSASELATANGYTAGGQGLANITFTRSSAIVTFDADDSVWSASGGAIAATGAIVYYDNGTKPLMCYINFGATASAGDGTQFKITWSANGIIRVTRV